MDWWGTAGPWERIWPRPGGRRPLIRLTRVVLPAPLEPMRASSSPWLTVKSTRSTAWVSPKYFTRSFVESRPMSGRLPEPVNQPAGGPDDAPRQRQDQDHEHAAQEHLPVHRVPHGEGFQVVEHHRADDGPGEGLEAAEHGEEDDLAREGPVQDVGGREPVQRHLERPGQRPPGRPGQPRVNARDGDGC